MKPFRMTLQSPAQTAQFGAVLARELRPGRVILLDGDLGTGKTFLVGAMARSLGLDPAESVASPTFSIVSELPTNPPLLHADVYRLRTLDEWVALGVDELLAESYAGVVEWGSRLLSSHPMAFLRVELRRLSESTREVNVHALRDEAELGVAALRSVYGV